MTSAHDSNDSRIFQKECLFMAKESEFELYLIAPGLSRDEGDVKVIGMGEKPTSRIKRMFRFSDIIYKKALTIDADIYHIHDPELLGAALKLKRKGKLVIFDSHENTVEQIKIKKYMPAVARKLISWLYKNYETFICRRIDAVIFPCLYNGKNPFANRCKNIVFINNVPSLAEFPNAVEQNKLYDICVIGSLTEERGITNLLKACKKSGAKIELGGFFSSSEYEKKLEAAELLQNVEYLGFCERDKVIETYSKSKIGVSTLLNVGQYPNVYNLSTKVYEYMAMNMPVIISNFKYVKETLKEYEFGISVSPEDVDEIADAIEYLLKNNDVCEKMGSEGRRAIEEVFNWETEVKKIKELYVEVYKKRGLNG